MPPEPSATTRGIVWADVDVATCMGDGAVAELAFRAMAGPMENARQAARGSDTRARTADLQTERDQRDGSRRERDAIGSISVRVASLTGWWSPRGVLRGADASPRRDHAPRNSSRPAAGWRAEGSAFGANAPDGAALRETVPPCGGTAGVKSRARH